MHFLYLAASIALVKAAALPSAENNNNNNINKRNVGPTSAEISACLNSALPSYSAEDQDAVRCICHCGGYGCANVPQSSVVDIKYRLNPQIPDACYSKFLSADAGLTPPTGPGSLDQYETENADGGEEEEEEEEPISNPVRIAGYGK